jgi:hypothetical protein
MLWSSRRDTLGAYSGRSGRSFRRDPGARSRGRGRRRSEATGPDLASERSDEWWLTQWVGTIRSSARRSGPRALVFEVEIRPALPEMEESAPVSGGDGVELARAVVGGGAEGYLPMPRKTSALKMTELWALADAAMATRVVEAADAERLARARANAGRRPSRVFANALVNSAWRNGPVESLHAGESLGYPIDCRRFAPSEEREPMDFASGRLALGMTVCLRLAMERPRRPWEEQVLPYGLAEILLITPSGWTTTEATREVRLPG